MFTQYTFSKFTKFYVHNYEAFTRFHTLGKKNNKAKWQMVFFCPYGI